MQKGKDRSPLNNAGQQMIRESTSEGNLDLLSLKKLVIEDLKNELKQKDLVINMLQRNFEGISLNYKEEMSKSLE